MDRVRTVWRGLAARQRILAIGLPVALVAAIVGGSVMALGRPAGPGPIAAGAAPSGPATTSPPLPPDPTLAPDASPIPSPTPAPPMADSLLGTDGRLTVLLLGSDYRPAHPGNRTDAIMIVSVDPTTGKAAGVSIPRDTTGFPLGTGKTYGARINGLYEHLQSTTGNGGLAMRKVMADAFDIEIDGYVFIGFKGVKELVAAVGGVDVTLDRPYYDAAYWVTASRQGWGLPAGTSHLGPNDALIFARSRKGDNDFGRARRQQILVLAALDKVRRQGPDRLPRLLRIAARTVRTDLPLDRTRDLFDVVATTDISTVERTVFGPTTYAQGGSGSSFSLKMAVCRKWIAEHFPAIRPMGGWPATGPSGSPTP